MKSRVFASLLFLLLVSGMALAQSETYKVTPSTYDPTASGSIVSSWIKHLGLQDPGETDNEDWGLLLSKNTASTTNAAAVANIGYSCCAGNINIHLTELGFDYRDGGHCGAGSPRFNVTTSDKHVHFVGGCANGTSSAGPAAGWTRVRFDPSNSGQAFPPVLPTDTVLKIQIVADEGTDTGPDFSGMTVLDNIDINGDLTGENK
jgi:hypothetical protein